jgi:hypothetical protein
MPPKYLPAEDHIARHIRPRWIMRDEDTNEPIGVLPVAFELRPGERDLSVSWLEVFPGTRMQQLRQVVDNAELDVRPSHAYAVFQVEAFVDLCASKEAKVRIIHEPTTDESHSAVHRYPRDNPELTALLANVAADDLTLVKDIP